MASRVCSLACVRVKGGESKYFFINSGVRRVYRVSLGLQCIYGRSGGGANGDGEEGREWRLPGLLYVDDLVLCEELRFAEELRLAEECRSRGLKVKSGKSKVLVLGGLGCL